MATEKALFAVSSGNGNDGVSRLYPDYFVEIDPEDAFLLAELAAVSEFKAGYGRRWCREQLEVDGETEYGISATILDPPGQDGAGWSEANGAWRIWEVFPAEQASTRSGAPTHESLADCFGRSLVAAAARRRSKCHG